MLKAGSNSSSSSPSSSSRTLVAAPGRMPSRKSLSILAFAGISLIILLLTSRRMSSWSGFDAPHWQPHPRPPPPLPLPNSDRPLPPLPGNHDGTAPAAAPIRPGNHTTVGPSAYPLGASFSKETDDRPPRPRHDPSCAYFPDTSGILVVMKTGASESYERLPTQLVTMLKCLPDFLVFSDMDQHIGGYRVRDSLDAVLPEARDGNPDFDLYRRQQACAVDTASCNKLSDNPASEGWNLDKYKNVHIAEKTWALRPGRDWYVFVDADTYVLWPNMVQWLRTLNPAKKLYLGSVTAVGNFVFGHGGSGYVVSRAAMNAFVGKNKGVANKYDVRARKECCGDYIFGLALKDHTDVGVQNMWPTINGEKPFTLPFGGSHWCHPVVTMHHMNSEEINTFWEYERRRYTRLLAHSGGGIGGLMTASPPPPPVLLKDIYHAFVGPRLEPSPARDDWDNLSDDRFYMDLAVPEHHDDAWRRGRMKDVKDYNEHEMVAHLSFEHCARACESVGTDDCFQFMFRGDGVCAFSRSFKMGHPVKRPGGDNGEKNRMRSGWDVKKITKWIGEQGECKKVLWPHVNS